VKIKAQGVAFAECSFCQMKDDVFYPPETLRMPICNSCINRHSEAHALTAAELKSEGLENYFPDWRIPGA
jgi:hypothetical protein